jgi:hypothetical protein
MPYSDFITATPQPQLTCVCNLLAPGSGLVIASYFGKDGVCLKTLGLGLLHLFIDILCQIHGRMWFSVWIPFIGLLFLVT